MMLSFPILYTPRLILRQLSAHDIPSLLYGVNNRRITNEIVNFPYPFEEYHAVHRLSYIYNGFKKDIQYIFAIILREDETETFVGEISLHRRAHDVAELSYWVAEPFWRKGICTEAIQAVTRFAFDRVGIREIYAECRENNIGSRVVLEKNDFVAEQKNAVIRYARQSPSS